MYIKNKIVRFFVSFIIAMLLYFVVIFLTTKDISEVFIAMLAYFLFTFYLTIPPIGYAIYKINSSLTPIVERSKEKTSKNRKTSKLVIVGIVLLVLILLFRLSSN